MSSTPTVVLVHGAFADASSFARVVTELLADGTRVLVPAVPNRSLAGDAAYVASVVRQIEGPVLLVGHSYGGAVITVAGREDNVVGLVYLAAYVLDKGESLGELQSRFPDSPLAGALVYTPFPVEGSDEPGTDVSVDIARFPESSPPMWTPTSRGSWPFPSARWPGRLREPADGRLEDLPAWGSSRPPTTSSTPTSSGSATNAPRSRSPRSTPLTW